MIYKRLDVVLATLAKAYDAPADMLISKLTDDLREEFKSRGISAPSWIPFVKTGVHADRAPHERDWWYTRCASLLRKIYLNGPIGVGALRTKYGGASRRSHGYGHAHHVDAGGAIIRGAVHALESIGYVERYSNKGRVVSSAGMKKVDRAATTILAEMTAKNPGLGAYR